MDDFYDNRLKYYQNKLEELEKEQRKLSTVLSCLEFLLLLVMFVVCYIYVVLKIDIMFRVYSTFALLPFLPLSYICKLVANKKEALADKIEHVKKAIEEENIKTGEKTRDGSVP